MNSVERVKGICKERRIPISKLEKDLGFSNGYIGQLKKGSFPDERLKRIAEYLNVSVNYLMASEEDSNNQGIVLNAKDEKDIAKDLDNIIRKLSSKAAGPASYNGEELNEEAAALFRDELEIALRRLKLINKEKYNPNKNKE